MFSIRRHLLVVILLSGNFIGRVEAISPFTSGASAPSNMNQKEMLDKISSSSGFFAALDQSGGSTPKALATYGVPEDTYVAGEKSMYDLVHEMRSRIITSPAFTGEKVLGAILFEDTMDREIEGLPAGEYLWVKKRIVPFIKIDKGLEEEENGVQIMKSIPNSDLVELLIRSKTKGMFGTKMRSVIRAPNQEGIEAVVEQQFAIARKIMAAGLIPIVEPEVDILCSDKAACETTLKACLKKELDRLGKDEMVILKLTLPTEVNAYEDLAKHPKCLHLVALSGGYTRQEANSLLAKQSFMIASFSRALSEGLSYSQGQEEFDDTLAASVHSIYEASKAGHSSASSQ